MAEEKIKACLERVVQAERSLSQLYVVEKHLFETREALQEMLDTSRSGVSQPGGLSSALPPKDPPRETLLEKELKAEGLQQVCLPVQIAEIDENHEIDVPVASGDEVAIGAIGNKFMKEELSELSEKEQVSVIQKNKEEDLQEIAEDTAEKLGIEKDDVLSAWRVFSATDTDATGTVSITELHKLLEQVTGEKMTEMAVNRIMKKFDKDSDGELDFEEFLYCYCYTPHKKLDHLKAAVFAKGDHLDDKFRTRMVGVPADDLKNYLQKEMDEEASFLQIPGIFCLFFFFVLSSTMHHMTALSGSVENAVRFDITENANFAFVGATPFENGRYGAKNIQDVNCFEDFWSWLDLGLVPMFFPMGWITSEARQNVDARCVSPLDAMDVLGWSKGGTTANTPYSALPQGVNGSKSGAYAAVSGDLGPDLCKMDTGTSFPKEMSHLSEYGAVDPKTKQKPYLLFNEIVAGMRMRQEQMPVVECTNPDFSSHIFSTPCIGLNDAAWVGPDLDTALKMDETLVDMPGGRTVYLKSGTPITEVHKQIRQLENSRWFNQQTAKIELAYTLYNNHVDMFVVTFINFFINRAGHIHKIIKPVAIHMSPYSDPMHVLVDAIFALFVFKLFVEEARQVYCAAKEHGTSGLKLYFGDFKNAVDWCSIGYSLVIFVMWYRNCAFIANLRDLLMTASTSVPGSWASPVNDIYHPANAAYWQAVDETARFGETFQVVLAFYPFFIGMRFMSAFSGQPRLGLFTTTLKAAANDLLHFLVVLMVTIMVFCASAVILFGREVAEFENFGRTYISVFRTLMGDSDYEALTEVGRFPASLWWTIFMVCVNMVMVNMVLAIIMDVYGSVKGAMGDDVEDFPTIYGQSEEIFRRWNQKRKGLRMSIHDIMLQLEKHEAAYKNTNCHSLTGARLITVSTFVKLVDGLEKKQAERLLKHAQDYYDIQKGSDASVQDCLLRLRSVDLKVQQVHAMAEEMHNFNRDNHDILQTSFEESRSSFNRATSAFADAVNKQIDI